MHICFICNEYPPGTHGGIGSFTQMLARALVLRGHAATVVGTYPAHRCGEEDDQGVRVIRLAHASLPYTGFVVHGARLRRALAEIHAQTPIDVLEGPELSMAMVPRRFPAAKLIRMHGGHRFFHVTLGKRPRAWRSWMEKRSFARADHLCAVSRYVGETTRELLKLGQRPIEVLPNPVSLTRFQPRDDVAERDGLILFVGTLTEKKGVRQLVQAMDSIVNAVPDAHLWIVGRDSRDPATGGSYAKRLRALVPPHLVERVEFKGAIGHEEIPATLAKAQVCVYPSHMEAMPLAWLEAMAMGKALVASRTGPGPEVVEEGASGLLCDPTDPASIAAKVIALLADKELRRSLGAAARRRVAMSFSTERMVALNEAFYERCARERASAPARGAQPTSTARLGES